MTIRRKRAYDPPAGDDGARVLVERLWPRGLRKEDAAIDLWIKPAAPSTELRKWYGHDPERWEEFRRRYFAELDAQPEVVAPLEALLAAGPVTFVYGSRETEKNSAAALAEWLDQRR